MRRRSLHRCPVTITRLLIPGSTIAMMAAPHRREPIAGGRLGCPARGYLQARAVRTVRRSPLAAVGTMTSSCRRDTHPVLISERCAELGARDNGVLSHPVGRGIAVVRNS
jgi:hypothetical protein